MASKKKLLQAAAGSAGGAGLDVDEVFSTYLYEGTGSAQTITNGVDLSGEGGLVWIKRRTSDDGNSMDHVLIDSERRNGTSTELDYYLRSNTTDAEISSDDAFIGTGNFNNNGFAVGYGNHVNKNNNDYVSWTFRKAPKFFDVVTFSATGSGSLTLSHNLGSVPAFIIVKSTSHTQSWYCYHHSLNGGTDPEDYFLKLDSDVAKAGPASSYWGGTAPTSTQFTVGTDLNISGRSYVAYLFAHNDGDGDFGPNGDQDIIKCGSYTGNASTDGPDVNLGFEPQWVMIKNATSSADWMIFDVMRGIVTGGNDALLNANTSVAENNLNDFFSVTSTGFKLGTIGYGATDTSGNTYIYMAIRRGPLAAPESATDVFDVDINTQAINSSNAPPRTPFPVDMGIYKARDASGTAWPIFARLQGANYLQTQATDVEGSGYTTWDQMDGWGISTASWESSANYVFYNWKRAPSYFDVCCYSGTGSARTVGHNLTVPPEMMWIKRRSAAENWAVYHSALGNNKVILLQSTGAAYSDSAFNNTTPTNSVFSVSNATETNASGSTYIAYLFATVAGVSKVGSWTMASGNNNIDCGFTSGARFVLIKDASASGAWIVWDSVRGIVAGNDPYLELNSTNAEYTTYDYIDPLSSGFTITSAYANFYAGNTYIFYAIA